MLPTGLAEALAACAADLDGARGIVVEARARIGQDDSLVDDAVRERVRAARAAGRAARTSRC